jgi:hypothetical protein
MPCFGWFHGSAQSLGFMIFRALSKLRSRPILRILAPTGVSLMAVVLVILEKHDR